jgi:hypothetical protein
MSVKNPYLTLFDRTNTPYIFWKKHFNPYQQDVGSPEYREPENPVFTHPDRTLYRNIHQVRAAIA